MVICKKVVSKGWCTESSVLTINPQEQSGAVGLHCLPFRCTLWTSFSIERPLWLNFRVITAKILDFQKFRTFTLWYVMTHLGRIMKKQTFCVCKNKGADQLRGKREADQRLCFCYIDSTIPLLSKSKISSL